MEVMRFRGEIQSILNQVLTADPRLGPVYLIKVNLADAYMRLLVRMEEVPSVAFLFPKKKTSNTQLVGFHLSLPMGYVYNAPCVFMATDTVADLTKEAISQRKQAREHPLKMTAKVRVTDDSGVPEAQADASW